MVGLTEGGGPITGLVYRVTTTKAEADANYIDGDYKRKQVAPTDGSTPFTAYRKDVKLLIDDETGNMGIGTTSPRAKLDVYGYIRVGFSVDATSDANPQAGTIRFDTITAKFQGYDGTAWVDLH